MPPPILSGYDHERLRTWQDLAPPSVAPLVADLLRRALVLSRHARLPCGTIAIGAPFDLRDTATGATRRLRIVAPDDPDVDRDGAVSMLDPLGLALLGRAEGDRISPGGDDSCPRWKIAHVPRHPVAVAAATL